MQEQKSVDYLNNAGMKFMDSLRICSIISSGSVEVVIISSILSKEDRKKIREMLDEEYQRGYAEANAQIKPVIQRIHDCVFLEGFEKGQISKWHKPSEKLPKDGEAVLAIINGEAKRLTFTKAFVFAEYSAAEGWILPDYPDAIIKVLSWQELPDEQIVERIIK